MAAGFAFQGLAGQAVVRPAREGDIAGIARVSIDTWRLTYASILPPAYLARMRPAVHEAQRARLMAARGSAHLVAEEPHSGEVVGFANAGHGRGMAGAGEIYELYVQNGFQGQGLGRSLFDAAVRWLIVQGHSVLIVWVLADNPARAFYERLGGCLHGRQTLRVGGSPVEEAAYVWRDLERWR